MKKYVLLLVSIIFLITGRILGQSQVGNYNFQSSIIAYNEISGGILLGSESNDDQRFVDPANPGGGTITKGPGFPIGFNVIFAGEEFDRVAINSNGWISLGKSSLTPAVDNSSTSANLPISSTIVITPPELVSRIAALARDLQGQAGSTLRIQTVGVAPNRECVIQWKGYKKYGAGGNGDNFNFQIRLTETSNQVKLIYGLMVNASTTAVTVQVGLRAKPATEATNYHNRETTSDWTVTSQGIIPTASCTLSSTVYPVNGLCFLFSPLQEAPGCAVNVSPQDGAGNVTAFATLNWSPGGGGNPAGYKLYFGTDYPPSNIANGLDLGNVTIYDPIPDLQYNQQYFWKIIPYNSLGEPDVCDIWSFTTMNDPTIYQLPFYEGFDSEIFPPLAWLNFKTGGPGNPGTWDRQTNGANPTCLPHSGAAMARYNSFNYQNGTTGVLVTPSINVGAKTCNVSFWMYRDPGYPGDPDRVSVYYNTTSDLNGASLLGTINRNMNLEPIVLVEGWYQYNFDFQTLPGNNYLIFEGWSDYGNNMFIDEIAITSQFNLLINGGQDLYTVPEATIGFGLGRGYPAIPENFFGPGSDPFEGIISLKGMNSDGSQMPYADVLVHRLVDVEFAEYPAVSFIETEMVQLNLVSVDPIIVTRNDGRMESFFDVFIEIPEPQPGNMIINLENETGGTFFMNFLVNPLIKFRNVDDPTEEYTLNPPGMGWLPLEFGSETPYPWTTTPMPGEFDPIGYDILPMPDGTSTKLNVLPLLQRSDHTFVEMSEDGFPVLAHGTGYNGGTYYYYQNTNWWNVWFYDHPFTPIRRKVISGMIQILPRNPSFPTFIEIVYNWSRPPWPGFPMMPRPPLPEDVPDPMMEEMMIMRSDPIFMFPPGPLFEPIMIPLQFEFPEYNPEWLSLDIRGFNFILIGDIIHTCWDEWEGGGLYEFGDAPENDMAYIGGAIGQFPTCMNVGPAGYIRHGCPNPLFFGGSIDCEGEGNAGFCPMFNPNTYNMDECGTFPYPVPPPPHIDEGLMFPTPLTIVGPPGAEQYLPCGPNFTSLGSTCMLAQWGQNIDIWINAGQALGGFVNVLFDWNQDGIWFGASSCPIFGTDNVIEHVLQNFPVPAGYVGPLSGIPGLPPFFEIGPYAGPVWARFTLTEQPVILPWDGSGDFADGETEDYLLSVNPLQLDFGDAPAPYPTLYPMGAYHDNTDPNIFLGLLKDFELDGFPDDFALGDDNNNLDDEDGVVLNGPVLINKQVSVTVTSNSQGALLHAWADFNGNGSWADAGEQIFTNQVLNAGPNALTFHVPINAQPGPFYVRFRINTQPNTTFTGYSVNGEVEDYMWEMFPELDFGDAPAPYPTTLAQNGARHFIDGITFLGDYIDAEPDGQPTPFADGDDLNGIPDDEDGVTFLWPLAAGNPCKIKLKASVGDALLNVWIDFNRNGSWADPGEHVFVDFNPIAGDNILTFITPAGAVPGPTYARFRFGHQPALSFTGGASDGEVEDYMVEIMEYGDIKWQQLPEPGLPGLHAHDYSYGPDMLRIVLADDWECYGGLVTDIHWWGNYEIDNLGNEFRGLGISHFHLSIHNHDPLTCLPVDPEIWGFDVPLGVVNEQFTGIFNNEGCKIYSYEFILPVPFDQMSGNRYWLDITAVSNDPNAPPMWRWQEANRSKSKILCGAANKLEPGINPWTTILWNDIPPFIYSDMAFAITSDFTGGDEYDFGDAPDGPYSTLLVNNGAKHLIVPGMHLGTTVDPEPDGQPDFFAMGDDLDGNDDEDGIIFFGSLIPGQNSGIIFTNVAGAGYLNAWFDWNGNGSWADPGEHVFVDFYIDYTIPPTIAFILPVPANAVPGMTYARFRYSSVQGLNYDGPAPDGEVEDYRIKINEPIIHKMHYPQYPDPNGWDVNMTFPRRIGDDWMCSETGYVEDFHFWVSFHGDIIPPEFGIAFEIQIYSDIPAALSPSGYSMPGTLLWARDFSPAEYTWQFDFEHPQGWFDPYMPVFNPIDHLSCFRIDIMNFDEPFLQEEGNIYWLVITAHIPGGGGIISDYIILTLDNVDPNIQAYQPWGEDLATLSIHHHPNVGPPAVFIIAPDRIILSPAKLVVDLSQYAGTIMYVEIDIDEGASPGSTEAILYDAGLVVDSKQSISSGLQTLILTNPGGAFNPDMLTITGYECAVIEIRFVHEYPYGEEFRIGWKTSLDHFNDVAVWQLPDLTDMWEMLIDPITLEGLSLSFVITGNPIQQYDFGDAPEGALAYPASGVIGQFPTCTNVGPPGSFIQHNNFGAYFGPSVDFEPDGNAGACPIFNPNMYNQDECFTDGDAGLLMPGVFTIVGPPGSEIVVPCPGSPPIPLGNVCTPAFWGANIDIHVQNIMPAGTLGFVNVLIDWNQDGVWSGFSTCPDGTPVPEHVLVDFPVPNGFIGPLSALMPPPFIIGPDAGYVWARISITEIPVGPGWHGAGIFEDGETEDYLLHVIPVHDLNLQNQTVPGGTTLCFDAANTITTAGGGTTFIVQNGAVVYLVAGNSIHMLPGTHFQSGSYVHAYIDQTGEFCSNPKAIIAEEETLPEVLPSEFTDRESFFWVYPNPTRGQFTLELRDVTESSTIKVEIFSLIGESIMKAELPAMKHYLFDLSARQPGIYLIRVMKDNDVGVVKLIRQ